MNELDSRWGSMPTPDQLRDALKRNDERLKERIKLAIDLSYESQRFAQELGITVEQVWQLGEQRQSATFSVGTTKFYPEWQLHEGKIVDGIEQVISNFWGDGTDLAVWGNSPSVDLDGKTPAEALKEGKLRLVIGEIIATDPTNK